MFEKIPANALKIGTILVIENSLWKVAKPPEHVKPGKGPAYVQTELKNVKTGTKKNERFNSSDYLDKAFLEQKTMQYLYADGNDLILMDTENYDQININKNILDEDRLALLSDNMMLKAQFFGSEIVELELPHSIIVEVIECDPVIKGATASPSYKSAIITNNVRVKVPPYISQGEKIVIKTEDLSFVERAK